MLLCMELLSKILGPNLVPGSGERRALVPPKPPEHISFSAPLNQGCCALLKTPRRTLPAWHNSWQHYDDGGCCSDVTNDIKRVDLSLAFLLHACAHASAPHFVLRPQSNFDPFLHMQPGPQVQGL